MSKLWLILCSMLIGGELTAGPENLDELLNWVHQERVREKQDHLKREQRFLEAHNRQQELLHTARQELAAEQARRETIQQTHKSNTKALEDRQQQLNDMMGSLNELRAVFSQLANETASAFRHSILSTAQPGRLESASRLAELNEHPPSDDLENLWQLLLEEAIGYGEVTRFLATVVNQDGIAQQQEVIRVGSFNLMSKGRYLRHFPQTGKIVEPRWQPPYAVQKMALALEQADHHMVTVAIDPTRGAVLDLIGQTPDIVARIRQSGVVGYLILLLGFIGLSIAIERFIVLSTIGRRVKRQLNDGVPNTDNPLGRIVMVHREYPHIDLESLDLKLNEAILKELPGIRRGLGALSILAAVAPLLGLLGTVTGIINTFQSITLFGTDDPRLMSGGISLALTTTVLGLIVAIPILLFHSYLASKSNWIIQILDEKSAALVAMASERGCAS